MSSTGGLRVGHRGKIERLDSILPNVFEVTVRFSAEENGSVGLKQGLADDRKADADTRGDARPEQGCP